MVILIFLSTINNLGNQIKSSRISSRFLTGSAVDVSRGMEKNRSDEKPSGRERLRSIIFDDEDYAAPTSQTQQTRNRENE